MGGLRGALALVGALLAHAGGLSEARGGETRAGEMPRLLTADDRAALRRLLDGRVVALRRTIPPPKGMIAAAEDVRFGQGLCVAPGRVLTGARFVADHPLTGRGGEDRLVASARPGETPRVARVAWVDADLGVAVLAIEAEQGVPFATPDCAPPERVPTAWDTGVNVAGFAVIQGEARLREIGTLGHAAGVRAWYVAAQGDPLPSGTPVFSTRGSLISLVGDVDPEQPRLSFLVPAPALALALEARSQWSP